MKILYVNQTDLKDCGVSCLISIIRYYGGYVRREYLREITNTTENGVSAYSLVAAAPLLGFEACAIKGKIDDIKDQLPLIAHCIINKNLGHFVVISSINSKYITVMDPNSGFRKYTYSEWNNITTNTYILYKPKNTILKQDKEKSFFQIFYPIVKKYKTTLFLILVFSLIYTVSNIFLSYGFGFFLNLEKNKFKNIFFLLSLIVLLKETTNLYRGNLMNYLNHKLDKMLITEVYNHIIKLPYSYIKNRMKGDIIKRLEDVSKIRDTISKVFVSVSIDILFVLILFLAMLKLHKKLSLYVLVITLLYGFVVSFYHKKISKGIFKAKEKEVMVQNHIIESLSSIDTIKGMGIEKYLSNKLETKYSSLQEKSFLLNKTYNKEIFLKELIYGIGSLFIIYIGCLEVKNNVFSVSHLIVFYTLMMYYFTPLVSIFDLEILLKDASISFLRIKELLNIKEEYLYPNKKSCYKPLKGNIKVSNLNYSYNGIDSILKCDKLKIKKGERVLLYGTSGGGKSSLMKILIGYFNNYKGSILIDDKEVYDYNLEDIRKKITYVSQDEILYTDTIYNNIVLNNEIDYDKYLEILELTGVNLITKRSILHSDMMIENNASNLSGGERQRILLARSLVKNSDIYIFDESFSAIDIKNERILLKNIFEYLKNKTVIVISHRFNNRDLYQKFILIEKGMVYEY